MKKLVLVVLVALIVVFSSCERKSNNNVGLFTVIKKIPVEQNLLLDAGSKDVGTIRLVSSKNDTLNVMTLVSAVYLNTRVGDKVPLFKNHTGSLGIKYTKSIFQIGYCKVIGKEENVVLSFRAVSRGGDTITVPKIPEVIYYNIGVGDSVYVKLNSEKKGYYTE